MLFEIARADAGEIVAMLDHREQGGYVKRELEVTREVHCLLGEPT